MLREREQSRFHIFIAAGEIASWNFLPRHAPHFYILFERKQQLVGARFIFRLLLLMEHAYFSSLTTSFDVFAWAEFNTIPSTVTQCSENLSECASLLVQLEEKHLEWLFYNVNWMF